MDGIGARVVITYGDSVLPRQVTARVTVEEGSPLGVAALRGCFRYRAGHANLRHVGAYESGSVFA
jgi:hypothetical protein